VPFASRHQRMRAAIRSGNRAARAGDQSSRPKAHSKSAIHRIQHTKFHPIWVIFRDRDTARSSSKSKADVEAAGSRDEINDFGWSTIGNMVQSRPRRPRPSYVGDYICSWFPTHRGPRSMRAQWPVDKRGGLTRGADAALREV